MPEPISKVSIIVSKGSLEGIYPALIMANGARAEGIEANLFFTFFGMDAVQRRRVDHIKVATVGNPGMHIPTLLGGLPGMSALATHFMQKKMEDLDIPPISEFIEMIADTGAGLYASPRTTSWSRSRTSSPSATSTRWRPAARSSSPSAAAGPAVTGRRTGTRGVRAFSRFARMR